MKLLVTLEPDETGTRVAECPAIPGCISQERTEAEALANIPQSNCRLPGDTFGSRDAGDR